MYNTTRLGYCKELHETLEEFKGLEGKPHATAEDFQRLSARIKELCAILDSYVDGVH